MSEQIEGTTINVFQGDSATIPFVELPENSVVYFAVRDKKTNNLMFDEIRGIVDSNGNLDVEISKEILDKIPVNLTDKYTSYYYGLKMVDELTGKEDTILLGDNPVFGENYLFNVYRKKVEGE